MIILYTTHCPKCKVLETKLNQKKLSYTIVDNVDEITGMGIMSVPVLQVNDDLFSFVEANKWINEQEAQV
jgi:glutaredoxin